MLVVETLTPIKVKDAKDSVTEQKTRSQKFVPQYSGKRITELFGHLEDMTFAKAGF